MTTIDPVQTDPVQTYVASQDFAMLVGGRLVEAASGERRDVHDPSTGRVVSSAPAADRADVEAAIDAAADAQPGWEALGVDERIACIERFRELVHANRERLAMIDAIDCGNPVEAMRGDIDICEPYFAGWAAFAKSWLAT